MIGTWILINTNFVPISLYVTIEFVKVWQKLFMEWDWQMFDRNGGEKMQALSANLTEELG